MSAPILAEDRKRFTPKRRAPYLFQDEVIKSISIPKDLNPKNDLENYDSSLSKNINIPQKTSDTQTIITQNYHEEVSKLYGIQKKIAYYIVMNCIHSSSNTTSPVTLETFANIAQTTKKTVKRIIQRMIEKKLFSRTGGKCGKGGFCVFQVQQGFIDVVRLQLQLENNYLLSNNVSIKTDKAETNDSNGLPEEWKKINSDALEEIGFGLPQIKILYNKNITTPEVIQSSINHFAFALKYKNEKLNKYQNKLAVFMSTLGKGGTWTESDYMSPREIAFKQLADQKIAKIEMFKQKEAQLFSSEFNLWESSLTEEERNKILSENARNSSLRGVKTAELKNHFQEIIWPKKIPEELISLKEELNILDSTPK